MMNPNFAPPGWTPQVGELVELVALQTGLGPCARCEGLLANQQPIDARVLSVDLDAKLINIRVTDHEWCPYSNHSHYIWRFRPFAPRATGHVKDLLQALGIETTP